MCMYVTLKRIWFFPVLYQHYSCWSPSRQHPLLYSRLPNQSVNIIYTVLSSSLAPTTSTLLLNNSSPILWKTQDWFNKWRIGVNSDKCSHVTYNPRLLQRYPSTQVRNPGFRLELNRCYRLL